MDNNIEISLNEQEQTTLNSIKEDIIADVRAEIGDLGYDIVPTKFDGGKEVSKLVKKAQALKVDHDKEVNRIKNRYKDDMAEDKIKVLEADYRYEMQDLALDIDKAVEHDAFARAEEIEQIQNSDAYKQQKLEAMQTIAMLRQCGAEIPPEIFTDLIADVVAAKDIRSLELIGLMCGKGMCQAMTEQIIHNVNVSNQNKQLTQFADSAKQFLVDGEINLTLMGHMKLYEGK